MTNPHVWLVTAILGLAACATDPGEPSLKSNLCPPGSPTYSNTCIWKADAATFHITGPEDRAFLLTRAVDGNGVTERYVISASEGSYRLALNPSEAFARYTISFVGEPGLLLDFYHGKRVGEIESGITGAEWNSGFWWIAEDGQSISHLADSGKTDVFDLKSFARTRHYEGPKPDSLFTYGAHQLVRFREDNLAIEQWLPETESAVTLLERDRPIHSFWLNGAEAASQTDDGVVRFENIARSPMTLPLGYLANVDATGVLIWRIAGTNCTLALEHYSWGQTVPNFSREHADLCGVLYATWFEAGGFASLVTRVGGTYRAIFAEPDAEKARHLDARLLYLDERIAVLSLASGLVAYQYGSADSTRGILECANKAVDFHPGHKVAVFADQTGMVVASNPEHFKELDVYKNVDFCYRF